MKRWSSAVALLLVAGGIASAGPISVDFLSIPTPSGGCSGSQGIDITLQDGCPSVSASTLLGTVTFTFDTGALSGITTTNQAFVVNDSTIDPFLLPDGGVEGLTNWEGYGPGLVLDFGPSPIYRILAHFTLANDPGGAGAQVVEGGNPASLFNATLDVNGAYSGDIDLSDAAGFSQATIYFAGADQTFALNNLQISDVAVPEPGLFLLIGTGLLGLGIFRRKRV